MKADTLKEIGQAVQEENSDEIMAASTKLKRIEALLVQFQTLANQVQLLGEHSPEKQQVTEMNHTRSFTSTDQANIMSARERGRRAKFELIQSLNTQGVELIPQRGSLYKLPSGKTIGIAYASERQPSKWFLGLPKDRFDCVFLLCESEHGNVRRIYLPENFFQQYGSYLSESGGQTKFNVVLRGSEYFMTVPSHGSIATSRYQSQEQSLG